MKMFEKLVIGRILGMRNKHIQKLENLKNQVKTLNERSKEIEGRIKFLDELLEGAESEVVVEDVPQDGGEYLSIQEAANLFECTYPNIYAHIKRGSLKGLEVEGKTVVRKADVLELKSQKGRRKRRKVGEVAKIASSRVQKDSGWRTKKSNQEIVSEIVKSDPTRWWAINDIMAEAEARGYFTEALINDKGVKSGFRGALSKMKSEFVHKLDKHPTLPQFPSISFFKVKPSSVESFQSVVDWDKQPFGEVSDRSLAKKLGVGATTVRKYRNKRGIPAYKGR